MVSVRRAGPDDAEAIGRVQVHGWRWAYRDILPGAGFARLPEETMGRRWRTLLGQAGADDRTWIAEHDGAVAGFCHTGLCRDPDAHPGWYEVHAIYLDDESLTGRGIGRALLQQALEDMRARGAAVVTLWVLRDNARARRFYEAAGFTLDGGEKVETDGDGVRYDEVRYRLTP